MFLQPSISCSGTISKRSHTDILTFYSSMLSLDVLTQTAKHILLAWYLSVVTQTAKHIILWCYLQAFSHRHPNILCWHVIFRCFYTDSQTYLASMLSLDLLTQKAKHILLACFLSVVAQTFKQILPLCSKFSPTDNQTFHAIIIHVSSRVLTQTYSYIMILCHFLQ